MGLTNSPSRGFAGSKCRFNEIPCRITRLLKWFKKEPRRLGWVITISCFIFYTASYSLMYGFSILFIELQREFNAKTSVTGYVGCLMSATAYLSSPFTAFLQTKISHRSITIIGTLLCSVGAFTSSFVPSIYYLFLTLGFLFGLGVNFLFHASLCLQLEYFPTNSERPVTVGSGGFSASWLITLPMLHCFIQSYGWRIALQFMSAVILVLCLIACIPMSPLPSLQEENHVPEEEDKDAHKKSLRKRLKNVDKHEIKDFEVSDEAANETVGCRVFLSKPETWIYFLASAGTMSGWTFYFINLVSFLTSDLVGLTKGKAATIVFLCGVGEIVGKLVLIAIAGVLQIVPSIYVAILGNVLDALFTMGLAMSRSHAPAAAFVVMASFGRAIWHIYPITGGVEELRNANGVSTIFLTAMGAGYIMGSFLVGGLHDLTGSYEIPMVLVAGVFAFNGFLFALIPLLRYLRSRRRKRLGYYAVNVVIRDCAECNKSKSQRRSSKGEVLAQCNHRNLHNTVVVDDQKLYVDSLVSAV